MHIKLILIVTLLFSFQTTTLSQSLFTAFSSSEGVLSDEASERISEARNNPLTKSISTVNIGSVSELQTDGILHFALPGYPNDNLKAQGKHIEILQDGDYTWWGKIAASSEEVDDGGFISYHRENGLTFGHIEARNKVFEFFDLNEYQVLVEYDTEKLHEVEDCANGSESEKNQHGETVDSNNELEIVDNLLEGNTCPTKINLLVLYTKNAKNNCLSVESTARIAVGYMNSAIKNSGIANTRIQIAGITELTTFNESGNLNDDVEKYSGLFQTAFLRATYKADIVLLLAHDDSYTNAGIVREINKDSGSVYALSHISYASSKNNVAHEIGHLLGCHHFSTSVVTPDKASFFTKSGKTYRTIVMNSSKNRIPYYSNPNVKYLGKRTGRSDEFNAQQIFDVRRIVSGFFPDVLAELSINILGGHEVSRFGSLMLRADVCGGTFPYRYEWRTSPDGFTWSAIVETTSTYNFVPPFNNNNVYYIRLDVIDANNQRKSKIRSIEITNDHQININ